MAETLLSPPVPPLTAFTTLVAQLPVEDTALTPSLVPLPTPK